MEFTLEQIEFLLTKMSIKDIDDAKNFVPTICSHLKKNGKPCKNKPIKDGVCGVHSVKTDEERCLFVKKDGNTCSFRRKTGEFCGRHQPKLLVDCPICMEEINSKPISCDICNYKFHSHCLKKALDMKPTCPCCRSSMHVLHFILVEVGIDLKFLRF